MISYDPVYNTFFGEWEYGDPVPQIMWHITDVCLLGCPFCFAHKTNLSVDATEIIRLCSFLAELNVLKIDIAGGEPLTYKHLPWIVEELDKRNIHKTITTSGTGTNANKTFILNNHSLFSRIIMSLDSPTQEKHNSIRKSKSAWQDLMKLLDRLPPKERTQKVRINTVVTRGFVLENSIDVMVEVVRDLNVREWCLIQPHPANAKAEFYQHDITNEDFYKIVEQAKSKLGDTLAVLSRPTTLYSSYWVLHPDNILSKHTYSEQDDVRIDLNSVGVQAVLDKMKAHRFVLPRQ